MIKEILIIIRDIRITFFDVKVTYYIIITFSLFISKFDMWKYEKKNTNRTFAIGMKK